MKVIFLGTNGWYDNETGNTVCVLIDAPEGYILLDAGNGIHKLDRYMTEDKPAYLFLSHFHLDHIGGLHTIVRLNFPRGLQIFGQEGTRKILGDVLRQPYSVPIDGMPFKVDIRELPEDLAAVPFLEDFRPLVHVSPCTGFRFRLGGKVITYCTDTGLCDNLIELGRDADILITECSALSGQQRSSWPHLAPEDAVVVSKKSGAKRVVLVHFNASLYPTAESRRQVQAFVGREADNVTISHDDMIIEL
ncbi:putative metallo-beta-lactamase [Methanocella arvoryzae MRE50]|uniref:Metallo-beta-lactamase n=2 Tax=Methanocella TaxID=570266 RepID=Q0W4R6_METAR|nr:putative metallo-beta-lactamase [Methanocella arvoryzae MRE50]